MAAKNILLVCANPRGTNSLRLGEEERALKEALQLSKHRDSLKVTVLNAATIDDLRRELLRDKYDVVHFSGHGTRAGLVFEDAKGRLMVPNSSALGELLRRRGVSTALLNACYSLSVGSIEGVAADYTIAMEGPIGDAAAVEFTRGFYDAIGAGLNTEEAYEEGQGNCKAHNLPISAVLIKKGEVTTPTLSMQRSSQEPRAAKFDVEPVRRLLLGVALDTSGSMKSSIQNDDHGVMSRLTSAKDGLARLARSIRREVESRRRADSSDENFRIFVYAFGLRGGKTADLLSLVRATEAVDIEAEAETRKRQFEARARSRYTGMSDVASLARQYGFGGLVNDIERDVRAGAERAAREQITLELAELVLAKAEQIGDSNVALSELARLLERPGGKDLVVQLEPFIYGDTPMTALAREVLQRFARTPSVDGEDRVFLLVSDGEPTDGQPLPAINQMKGNGIKVVTCYVSDADVATPRLLLASPQAGWPDGAQLMFDAASEIDESGPFAKYLLRKGWGIEPRAKLFVQANHSEVLDEFVQMTGSTVMNGEHILPEGR